MPFSIAFRQALIELIFFGTDIPNLADNAATDPITMIWIALHSADPTVSGDQTTSEANYAGYARVGVPRADVSGWDRTNNVIRPDEIIVFPQSSGVTGTLTHASLGMLETGAGMIITSGPITPVIELSGNTTPRLPTTTAFTLT